MPRHGPNWWRCVAGALASLTVPVVANGPGIASIAIRQDPHQQYFTNPPAMSVQDDYQDDPLYHRNDLLNITWETALPSGDLILCQPALDGSHGEARLKANTSDHWFQWNVTYSDVTTLAGPVGSVFFFRFRPPGAQVPFFDSHYFNVSDVVPGQGPSIINSPGSTVPASDSSDNKTASASSTSSPKSNSSNTQSTSPAGSSSDAQAGSDRTNVTVVILVSVLVVLLASAAAAGLTWYMMVRKRKMQAKKQEEDEAAAKVYSSDSAHSSLQFINTGPAEVETHEPTQEIGSAVLSHEIEARQAPVELPAEEFSVEKGDGDGETKGKWASAEDKNEEETVRQQHTGNDKEFGSR